MDYFTTRNTVIVALVQVGVVVAGVLTAGACLKWFATFGLTPPPATTLLAEYGFLALALPVVWAAVTLRILRWRDESDEADEVKVYAVLSGFVLLLLLLIGVYYAAAGPLLRVLGAF